MPTSDPPRRARRWWTYARVWRGSRTVSVRELYNRSTVRDRIREYCGGDSSDDLSAVSLAALTMPAGPAYHWAGAPLFPPTALTDILETGADFGRSLWDTRSTLLFIDLDYHNQDEPAEAFRHPLDTFLKVEPVYRASRAILRSFDIPSLVTISGRGYHLVAQVPHTSPVARALAALAPEPPAWVASFPQRRAPWMPSALPLSHAQSYVGMGLLLEYVAHLVIRRVHRCTPIPVVLNGTDVGSGLIGRESISIDLSHAGDPMDQRSVRAAYSAYQFHLRRPDIFQRGLGPTRGPLVVVPRQRRTFLDLVQIGRTPQAAQAQSRHDACRLPDASEGVSNLLREYRGSRLAAFHTGYMRELPAAFDDDPPTLDVAKVPPCVAAPLIAPNDLLLRPERVQHLTRYLLSRGWRPARVAALIYSLYKAPHEWGTHWDRVDPRARAEFDVRVFAGLHIAGVDQGMDFNCVSAQEKGLCPRLQCPNDLTRQRDALLDKVKLL